MAESRKRQTRQEPFISPGSIIRLEEPRSGRGHKSNMVVVAQEINPVSGFIGFLKDYAVAGLAIGFIIGLQAQELVKALVASFIDPAFRLLFGEALSKRDFTLEMNGRIASFNWGDFAHATLNFLFVLAAIYIIFKVLKLEKFAKKPEDKKK